MPFKPDNHLNIGGKRISADDPTYFIADIAANHDSDLQRAVELIHLAAEAGADAAKFQHFKADSIVSDAGFKSLGARSRTRPSGKKRFLRGTRPAPAIWA